MTGVQTCALPICFPVTIRVSETQPTHGRATVASLTTDGLVGGGCNRGEIAPAYNDDDGQNSNAEFIAYARSDVPRLIAEVRRQQTTNEKLRDALQLLVTDVQDYEAWQRPCYALDVAQDALALVNR